MPDKYAILDAARAYRRAIMDASDDDLHAARQVLAREANDSDHAQSTEPTAHIAEAMQAVSRRRDLTRQRRGDSRRHAR